MPEWTHPLAVIGGIAAVVVIWCWLGWFSLDWRSRSLELEQTLWQTELASACRCPAKLPPEAEIVLGLISLWRWRRAARINQELVSSLYHP